MCAQPLAALGSSPRMTEIRTSSFTLAAMVGVPWDAVEAGDRVVFVVGADAQGRMRAWACRGGRQERAPVRLPAARTTERPETRPRAAWERETPCCASYKRGPRRGSAGLSAELDQCRRGYEWDQAVVSAWFVLPLALAEVVSAD